MKNKKWYEELFENYAETYEKECFTQGTIAEVDFIEKEIGVDKSKRILDVGCGVGRHSIELAKRGYRVTGFDLSQSQLNRAIEKAKKENLDINFFIADARLFCFANEYDLAIMLCEGAFPLMETDEMNYRILQNVAKSLKPGGKFIFTTLNGLFPLFHSVEKFVSEEGGLKVKSEKFDLMTFRDRNITEIPDDSGNIRKLECDERYYMPSEITWYLKTLGFKDIEIFGCTTGAYERGIPLTPEHFEMIVIAIKS